MPTEEPSGSEGTGSGAEDALIAELVAAYSPAVLEQTGGEARERASELSLTVRQIVKDVVCEWRELASGAKLQSPAETESDSPSQPPVVPGAGTAPI